MNGTILPKYSVQYKPDEESSLGWQTAAAAKLATTGRPYTLSGIKGKRIRAENVIWNTNGDPPSGMCSTRADVVALIESNALST